MTKGWYESTPDAFLFAIKMPKRITPVKKVKGVTENLEWFCASARELREKCGPRVPQRPPFIKSGSHWTVSQDILIGMFKVIQDFVHDSFAKGTNDIMKSMEVGDRRIMIERGRYHSLSVVYRGKDRGSLAERVQKVSSLIDQRFGAVLENWSGDLDDLRGLASLLPQVWKYGPRRRSRLWQGLHARRGTPSRSKLEQPEANERGREQSASLELAAEPPK